MDGELEQQLLLQKENDDHYTGDGSVDFKGQPVRKSESGTWRAFPFIFVTELCERLAFHGIDRNLVNYLTNKMHQGNVSAARDVTTWSGTCYLTPLIGAFLADVYLGKYWTIVVSSAIYLMGISAVTISASLPVFEPAECEGLTCPSATAAQNAILFLGLYLIAVGTGGIKCCASAFGADQFDDTDPQEKIGKGSFFNWFYFAISLGSLVSSTFMVWIQENIGWGLGFGIPASFMAIAIAIFICGTPVFRFQRPRGSPLTRVCQTIVASFRKWKLVLPKDGAYLYQASEKTSDIAGSRMLQHTEDFKFLDKAAVLSDTEIRSGNFSDNWRLCTVTQVEELKILFRMFPIWATSIVLSAIYAQMSTTFVEQGMYMYRTVGSFSIPAASMSTFNCISIILCVPIYDKVIKLIGKGKGLSSLQRMGVGLFISVLTMLAAAFVEIRRLNSAAKMGTVTMSILWQIPQYILTGVAESFFFIGKMDFFYNESPDAMRSFCTAFGLLTTAAGNYLNSIVLTIVSVATTAGGTPGWIPDDLNEGQLHRYFLLWAGLGFVNLLLFVLCAMRYKLKTIS